MERPTNITVHQAFYGEVDRSHGCITSTLTDNDLKSFLTAFTDRPSSIPAGFTLQPYYSGSTYGSYYIFTITFPDPVASRGGMVFTHALIVGLNEINNLDYLEALFSLFIGAVPDDKTQLAVSPLQIPISVRQDQSTMFAKYIQQTVERLVANKTPILFCGNLDSFRNTIFSIWKGLPFSFRKKFSFTAGFGVDMVDSSKTIIHFQKNFLDTLKSQSFISDDNAGEVAITSEPEQYILNASVNNSFEFFLNSLEIKLTDWRSLASCVRAFQLYSKIGQNISPDELRLLVRTVDKIAPNENQGGSVKNVIIQHLKEYISNGKDSNIKALRNIPLASFAKGESIVASAIDTLISKKFSNALPFDVATEADLCLLSTDKENSSWWHQAVNESLKKIGRERNDAVVINFWEILSYNIKYIDPTLSLIPEGSEYEELFTAKLPIRLGANPSRELSKVVRHRQWFLLHANLLLNYLEPQEAVIEQIRIEQNQQINTSGIPLLLSKIEDTELLDLALSSNENVLISEVGKRTITKPSLLEGLKVSVPAWLKIWSVSLEETKNLQHGIQDLHFTIDEILDLIRSRKKVPNNIVEYIGSSSFADIANYPYRKEVWSQLPIEYKSQFLNATANGYVEKLITDTLANYELEQELKNKISDDQFVSAFLNKHRNDLKAVLSVYEKVEGLKDRFLSDYLYYYSSSISEIESSRLGNLVLLNKFHLSAQQIFEKAKRNNSFRSALNICKSLLHLNFIDRLLYRNLLGEAVSEDALYDALFEFAKKTYYQGPEDRDIWKRAGGDASKLINHRTREDNWRQALNLVRYGGGGKHITAKSLIKEMLDDFPNNLELKELKKYF